MVQILNMVHNVSLLRSFPHVASTPTSVLNYWWQTPSQGPTTRGTTRRIPEDWASPKLSRPKLMFIWAKEDVKT